MAQEPVIDFKDYTESAHILLYRPPLFIRGTLWLFALGVVIFFLWSYFTEIETTIRTAGIVRPAGKVVTVEAIISGSIRNVYVKEGDTVKEGQTLFTFEYSERNLVYKKPVTAPVTGTVTKCIVLHAGQVVGEMTGLVSIAPEGTPLVVEAVVPDRDARHLREDMPVRLQFAAFPQQKYGSVTGKILSISPDIGKTRVLSGYHITTSIDRTAFPDPYNRNRASRIKLGMTVEVRIITEKNTVLKIIINKLRKKASLKQ